MRLGPIAASLLMLAVAVAGCSGDDAGGSGGEECTLEPVLCDPDSYLANHYCILNDVRPRVYAPDTGGPDSPATPWKQGDYWTYGLDSLGKRTTSTLVYYEDIDPNSEGQAQHYLVGTTTRDEALEHALFSVNPMLGRIHRTLYSPHESGVHADMFYFPLCEGSTWTTTFYDTQFSLTARRHEVTLPGGAKDPLGFRITGTGADGSTLTHDYSPKAKWFTDLELRRADGVTVAFDLQAFGGGKGGEYHFLRAQKDETVDLASAPQSTPVEREDGGEGPYDTIGIYIDVTRTATNSWVEVHVRDPAGNTAKCVRISGNGLGGSTTCSANPLRAEVPYQEGTWTVTVERPFIEAPAAIQGEVRLVSIYDRSGSV